MTAMRIGKLTGLRFIDFPRDALGGATPNSGRTKNGDAMAWRLEGQSAHTTLKRRFP
jgi:hypothetical protein